MAEIRENKMGVMSVKKLIVTMALPMMASMLVQALYNVVDSLFVARISEEALAAVTYAMPLQNLMIAVGSGTGVGVNAMLSKALGEKNKTYSDRAANTGILLTLFNAGLFLLLGLFGAGPFIATQTNKAVTAAFGTQYLSIVLCFSIGLMFQMMFERLLQSTGRTLFSMISQMTGAIINIILDPIMIFGLFGFPRLEVAGAAIATVIGQCIAATVGFVLNLKKNPEITFSFRKIFRFHWKTIRTIYFVGFPSILMMSIGSVMTYLLNLILGIFSETAVAVFGVYFKIQSFFFMPVFGLNNALIPILAFNYGARKKARIKEALKFAILLAICIMAAGTLVLNLFPEGILGLFGASEEMFRIGVPALRIISIHFPVAAVCIVLGSIFQAFSQSVYSLIVSVLRQLVALIPAAYLLTFLGDVVYVWWAFPIAEVMSLIVSTLCFRKVYGKIVVPMQDLGISPKAESD